MWTIKTLDIEASNYCNAACPMCARSYAGQKNPNLKLSHININVFDKIRPFLNDIETWSFCGNYGDPILHPDLIELIKKLQKINPNAYTIIHTNGGVRNETFWKQLAELPKLKVRFGIDGLEDTNHIYRKNVKWNRLTKNISTFIKHGGNAEWKFIVFKHNQHQVEKAQILAKQMNFSKFMSVKTNRFVMDIKNGMQLKDGTILEPADYNIIDGRTSHTNRPKENERIYVHCYTKAEGIVYINALGEVFPCCHLGFLDGGNPKYDTLDWLDRNKISLYNNNLEEIFEWFKEVEKRWNTDDCIPTCERICGKKSNPHLFKVTQL